MLVLTGRKYNQSWFKKTFKEKSGLLILNMSSDSNFPWLGGKVYHKVVGN